MQPMLDPLLPVERLTPDAGHYFFGYYDLPACSADGQYHLCQRVNFWDRLPGGDDLAALGTIRLADRAFTPFATTNAWNFQQGTMLQWHPQAPDRQVIFNRCVAGRYVGVIRDLPTGEERLLSRPVANVDPGGRYALSVNFSRLFDFRPGYGYANTPDPYGDVKAPAEDGIFLVELATGESTLLLSLARIAGMLDAPWREEKILVNHLTFNTDGTRFVYLVRNFADPPRTWWKTAVCTADLQGEHVYTLTDFGYASHYHWRDPQHLLLYGDPGDGAGLYLFTDGTPQRQQLNPAFFTFDGHCSYAPGGRWLLYDSYPREHYRGLYLYDTARDSVVALGHFYSDPAIDGDIRCDLHPRWTPTGGAITFDSLHEGYRGVYRIDVTSIVNQG